MVPLVVVALGGLVAYGGWLVGQPGWVEPVGLMKWIRGWLRSDCADVFGCCWCLYFGCCAEAVLVVWGLIPRVFVVLVAVLLFSSFVSSCELVAAVE